MAAQFIIGQRQIAAFKMSARKASTFVVQQSIQDVSSQIDKNLNILTKN